MAIQMNAFLAVKDAMKTLHQLQNEIEEYNDPATKIKLKEILKKYDELKEQYEKINASCEEYESLTVNGAVLIDGNYLYLEALRTIEDYVLNNDINYDTWNWLISHNYASEEEIKKLLDHIKDNKAEYLVNAVKWLVFTNLHYIYHKICKQFISSSKNIYVREELQDKINNDDIPNPSETMFFDWTLDVNIFDAKLPDLNKAIHFAETRCREYNFSAEQTNRALKVLRRQQWENFHEGGLRIVPYNLKNEYINLLEEIMKADLVLGKKYINVNARGGITANEKEVDTRLTIKGMELASQEEIDYVLLITNDGDFVPLVEQLKSNNKKVYLYSPGTPKRISRPLKLAIGKENCLDRTFVLRKYIYEKLKNYNISIDNNDEDLFTKHFTISMLFYSESFHEIRERLIDLPFEELFE